MHFINYISQNPFGMLMGERTFSGENYRWGFNGQEKDNEVSGNGNSNSAEFWQYDSRGRRWNVDPVVKPFESPYVSFACNPIYFIDDVGKDAIATVESKQRRFLFWTWNKTTLVIKAEYHYIEGHIDEQMLSAISNEYGTFKRINYNGAKVNVRFEISFIPNPEGTELDKECNGSDGQNYLQFERIPDQKLGEFRIEESSYMGIEVDIGKINTSVYSKAPNGDELKPNEKQKSDLIQYSILHGIGHNIGFKHDDKGIMNLYSTGYMKSADLIDPAKSVYSFAIELGALNTLNVQSLVNRIDEMTTSGREYWGNATEIDQEGKVHQIKDSGVTTIKSD
jgi:hypothetical protein